MLGQAEHRRYEISGSLVAHWLQPPIGKDFMELCVYSQTVDQTYLDAAEIRLHVLLKLASRHRVLLIVVRRTLQTWIVCCHDRGAVFGNEMRIHARCIDGLAFEPDSGVPAVDAEEHSDDKTWSFSRIKVRQYYLALARPRHHECSIGSA